ncbi:MAG: AMP-dependent synthetase [Candidatus Dadabacteria bacterium]|nr:MAG: AMP-dependent synthetase [Candidatus Dadabacteria bacterium]
MSFAFEPEWFPRPADLEKSNLARQLAALGMDYDAFLRWSVDEPEAFWTDTLERIGIRWLRPFDRVLDLSDGPEWARWFIGGELNIADFTVLRHAEESPERVAICARREDGTRVELSWRELAERVQRFAGGLRELGIGRGDAIGLHLPMAEEVVVALLAAAAIGAVVVPLFTGYGADAIATRLRDADARWLITADGFHRRARAVSLLDAAREACRDLDVRRIVASRLGAVALDGDEIAFERLLEADPVSPEPLPSDTPFMLIYTSGTTGRPKGTVHVHAGFPVKAAQDMYHLFDVQPDDAMYWLTDIGWMMGPWLILGCLTLGAKMVLYDGAPDYPEQAATWRLWADEGVSIAGVAPTFIRAIMSHPEAEPAGIDLSRLRILGSTGEPWNLEPWRWTLKHLGDGQVPIINYSGGTEISGGILGCVTLRPIKPMSFNTAVPGVSADVVDDAGKPVRGEVGNLVIRTPNPGMTRGFFRDPERYIETYWSRFPGVWEHGDLVYVDDDGYFFITGRSDDTIKVAGKRLGPAEMESAAVEHPVVVEAAAIGAPDALKGQVPVLFVVLDPQHKATPELLDEIRNFVGQVVGKALRPAAVYAVSDLPRTRNGKIMRRVVRRVYNGEDPGNLAAIVNPETIDEIRALRA